MKTSNPSKKRGIALIIVMAVLVAVTLLVAALLQLSWFNERETIRQLRMTQAHWLAEAGLEIELSRVAASSEYRNSLPSSEPSDPAPEALGAGVYTVKSWGDSSGVTIRSTGTTINGGITGTATVQLTLHYESGIPGAVIGLNTPGHTYINEDVHIAGDVYRNGTMEIDGTVDPNYDAWATTPPITGGGDYTENYIPDPDAPTIDKPYFYELLNHAADTNYSDVRLPDDPVLNDSTINLSSFTSNTLYICGDKDFSKTSTFNGPGVIAVSGTLDLSKNNAQFMNDITLVASNSITVNQHTTFGNNNQVFTRNNIILNQDIDGGAVAMLAEGNFTSDHTVGTADSPFCGIIYAEGNVTMEHKAEIYGTIIAGNDMDLGHSSHAGSMRITYDPSIFTNFVDVVDFNDTIIPNGDWQEIRAP